MYPGPQRQGNDAFSRPCDSACDIPCDGGVIRRHEKARHFPQNTQESSQPTLTKPRRHAITARSNRMCAVARSNSAKSPRKRPVRDPEKKIRHYTIKDYTHETAFSAKPTCPHPPSWISGPFGHQIRPPGFGPPPGQRAQASKRLSRHRPLAASTRREGTKAFERQHRRSR